MESPRLEKRGTLPFRICLRKARAEEGAEGDAEDAEDVEDAEDAEDDSDRETESISDF